MNHRIELSISTPICIAGWVYKASFPAEHWQSLELGNFDLQATTRMRVIIVLGISLLASARVLEKSLCQSIFILHFAPANLPQDARQFGLNPYGPPRDVFSSKKLIPQIDESAIREQLLWGPYKLTASNVCISRVNCRAWSDRESLPDLTSIRVHIPVVEN